MACKTDAIQAIILQIMSNLCSLMVMYGRTGLQTVFLAVKNPK